MFGRPWHRYAWAPVPLLSMSVLACLPFIVAAYRGVIAWWIAGLYTACSATVLVFAIVQPKVNGWFPTAVWTLMITAVVHVFLLDRAKPQAK
ncbi:hypothetical protein OTB20_34360 [Streptomyces sp. H27-H1]|uniref:hypothetical protein n=1 Tax=Streptomyces sp. H27-H1 TaxID=2996461 RepID=UPI0022708A76|nr:hypothetical protein [Streptomyces sp. H27-H1]MCY0931179.1 hypothetical protein [Streptomyces sp. H27-H1]